MVFRDVSSRRWFSSRKVDWEDRNFTLRTIMSSTKILYLLGIQRYYSKYLLSYNDSCVENINTQNKGSCCFNFTWCARGPAQAGRAASSPGWWSRREKAADPGPPGLQGWPPPSWAGCGRCDRSTRSRLLQWKPCVWRLPSLLPHLVGNRGEDMW